MQIAITPSMGASDFNASLYPESNPVNFQWMAGQFESYSHVLNDMGKQLMEQSKAAFQQKLEEANRAARFAARMVKNVFKPNTIRPLETIEELRSAEVIMQRYVLAQPDLRKLYNQQRIDGYSDTYVDVDRGCIGNNHYDYLRVMDGIAVFKEDDESDAPEWVVTEVSLDEDRDTRRLMYEEQMFIIEKTWNAVTKAIASGDDPTDIFGGKIG